MKALLIVGITTLGLMACQGGTIRKRNCKSCETTTSRQGQQVEKIERQVCGEDEISAYITSNTINSNGLSVVTTCK